MHGDVTIGLRTLMPLIATSRSPACPSRHEPAGEELSFPFLFEELDRLGYAGFVGCEYRPRAGTREGPGLVRALAKALILVALLPHLQALVPGAWICGQPLIEPAVRWPRPQGLLHCVRFAGSSRPDLARPLRSPLPGNSTGQEGLLP